MSASPVCGTILGDSAVTPRKGRANQPDGPPGWPRDRVPELAKRARRLAENCNGLASGVTMHAPYASKVRAFFSRV
jgi:hypothetical protein